MKCQECGSYQIDKNNGEYVCRNCGLILDDSPIEIEKGEPSGTLPSLPTAGIGNVDGRIVKSQWLLSTREKNIISAKKQIELISSKKNLPNHIINESYHLFIRIMNNNLNLGKSNIIIIYACIYSSCLIHNIPITAQELTINSDINPIKVGRMFRFIKSKLNLQIKKTDTMEYIPRYGSRLSLKQKTISLAFELLEKLKVRHYVLGKSPITLVACVLYLASHMNNDARSQREIAIATGIRENTLRIRAREVIKKLE